MTDIKRLLHFSGNFAAYLTSIWLNNMATLLVAEFTFRNKKQRANCKAFMRVKRMKKEEDLRPVC